MSDQIPATVPPGTVLSEGKLPSNAPPTGAMPVDMPGPIPDSHVTPARVLWAVRTRFNPFDFVTPDLLSAWLRAARIGVIREIAIVWEALQRRDPVIANVANKRKMAVARLPWEILADDDSPEAAAHKEALETFYRGVRATSLMDRDEEGGISLLVRQMADAVGMRYAVHEIVWQPSTVGLTAQFRFVPLWFFETRSGTLRFLPSQYSLAGIDMPRDEWLVTVGAGIMEPCCVLWMFKSLPLKDWVAYSEKFGTPGVIGKTDAPQDSDQWNQMVAAVQAYGADLAAVCNRSDSLEIMEAKGGAGSLPFPALIEYCDRGLASLWRGADLSTMSKGGEGAVGASVQSEESDILLEDDAALVSETLNGRVDRLVIAYHFGQGVIPKARFALIPPKKQNVAGDLAIDTFLRDSGVRLAVDDVAERYGRAVADEDDDLVLQKPGGAAPGSAGIPAGEAIPPSPDDKPPSNPDSKPPALANASGSQPAALSPQLCSAIASDMSPLHKRLAAILAINDPAIMKDKLLALKAELPSLLKDINADPHASPVFAALLAHAMAAGARDLNSRPAI